MRLQQIIQLSPPEIKQYVVNNEKLFVEMLLEQMGSADTYMRESVCYQLFTYCIHEKILTDAALLTIGQYIIDNHLLLQDIKYLQSDAVFMRSASALWLTVLVKDERFATLDDHLYEEIVAQSIEGLLKERDARGFINAKQGWADTIGVKAELCYCVLQDERFDVKNTAHLLQALSKVLWNEQVFTNNEDERFVKIIMAFIHKGIDEALFIEWVEQIFDRLEYYSFEVGYTQQWFTARTNILQLMKTLYFHLKFSHQYEQLRATTSIFIQKWLKLS